MQKYYETHLVVLFVPVEDYRMLVAVQRSVGFSDSDYNESHPYEQTADP